MSFKSLSVTAKVHEPRTPACVPTGLINVGNTAASEAYYARNQELTMLDKQAT
ncbi:hypothetical protein PtA15_2A77 [Puccinia triticina]|uniref:Uncharacterized protein n=1 Tax=Puccinia triticina TaxID=208348 RepID=A0ABY7C9B7_9BASI|nr:uncharacterized protein PtA15_2A77 [Puccinia triticina]WAQ81766.1 hypothetical protein PtA15_2A77 [Puccinia triticina]